MRTSIKLQKQHIKHIEREGVRTLVEYLDQIAVCLGGRQGMPPYFIHNDTERAIGDIVQLDASNDYKAWYVPEDGELFLQCRYSTQDDKLKALTDYLTKLWQL